MSGPIHFDFASISALHTKLTQEAASMGDTLQTVLGATDLVGQGWSGHAHDQFVDAITAWQRHGQQLTDALNTLRDLMQNCADSFQTRDSEFASVWQNMG